MESPPKRLSNQSPLDYIRARHEYYKKKKATIEKIGKKGKKLTKDEERLTKELGDTNVILGEYKFIITELEKVKKNNLVDKEGELESLVDMMFCSSLLDDATSGESSQYNEWRIKEARNFGKGLEREIKKLKDINSYFLVHEADNMSHSQALAECLDKIKNLTTARSTEYVDVKEAMLKIIRSKHFTAAADLEFFASIHQKGWRGGTLKQWRATCGNNFFSTSTLVLQGITLETWRLENIVRYIMRGIVKTFRKLDNNNIFIEKLRFDKIILEANYDVIFTEFESGKMSSTRMSVMHSMRSTHMGVLHSIIEEMLPEQNRPEDVAHFLKLLKEYKIGDGVLIYNHPCLWSPMENAQNLLFARVVIGTSHAGIEIKKKASRIPEERSNWTHLILDHSIFRRVFFEWVKKITNFEDADGTNVPSGDLQKLSEVDDPTRKRIGKTGLISFMNACICHFHEHMASQYSVVKLQQKGKAKVRHRDIIKTENDLFTVFPLYSSNFFYANRHEKEIKDIIVSAY